MEVDTKAAKLEAKKARRNAKGALTRRGNTLNAIIEGNRPVEEVQEALVLLQKEYDNVVQQHEKYMELVEEDEEFANEEQWIEICRDKTLILTFKAKDYVKSITSEDKPAEPETVTETQPETASQNITDEQNQPAPDEVIIANDVTENGPNVKGNNAVSPETALFPEKATSNESKDNKIAGATVENENKTKVETGHEKACEFRIEKPKMPTFNGHIRDYVTFRAD